MAEKLTCGYCRKTIRNGRWIGTLHLCVSKEERRQIDHMHWLKREQLRAIATGPTILGLWGQLADATNEKTATAPEDDRG